MGDDGKVADRVEFLGGHALRIAGAAAEGKADAGLARAA